mmetsp:Transcript_63952/g.106056  ORF Transcript_63952/g.106056 Transcript_63952/m.106056 type:complete len:119 (-) Transcript_63952:224-580(-)
MTQYPKPSPGGGRLNFRSGSLKVGPSGGQRRPAVVRADDFRNRWEAAHVVTADSKQRSFLERRSTATAISADECRAQLRRLGFQARLRASNGQSRTACAWFAPPAMGNDTCAHAAAPC